MSRLHSYSIFSNQQASMLYQAKAKYGTLTSKELNMMKAHYYSSHSNTYYLYDNLDTPLQNHAYSTKKEAVRASTIKAVQLATNPEAVLKSVQYTIHTDQKYVLGNQIHPFVAKVTKHTLHTYLNGQSLQDRITQDDHINSKINQDIHNMSPLTNIQNDNDKKDYLLYKKTGKTGLTVLGMKADYTKNIQRWENKLNQLHHDKNKKKQIIKSRVKTGKQQMKIDRQRKQPIYNVQYRPHQLHHQGAFSNQIKEQPQSVHHQIEARHNNRKHQDKQLSLNLNNIGRER